MWSSRTITLFSDPLPSRRGPSAFVISMLLHGFAIGLFYLGLEHTPRIVDQSMAQRYTVRLLNLDRPKPQMRLPAGSSAAYHVPQAVAHATMPGGSPAPPSVPQQLAQAHPAPQTLVQPDLPPNLLLPQEVPIPLVLLWSPENSPVKKIVPPPPQKAAAADVTPSLATPNRELTLADLKISSTPFTTKLPALVPSATSPVAVSGPERVRQVPETASKALGQPTPARVLSVSNIQLQQGAIALPMINETAPASFTGSLSAAQPGSSSGAGNPASKQNETGAGRDAGEQGDKVAAVSGPSGRNGVSTGAGENSGSNPNSGSGQGAEVGSGSNHEPSTDRITLPKDGQFGVVVVGASLADEYPEALGIWSDRLAYSVYLHVGLTKSWIMQYGLPRASEAAAAGNALRPEAPWPYLIVRPHLAPGDSNSDAILVHGFVNPAGRFAQLAVVFPAQFTQVKFLLNALEQWQFRPALQNGQATTVEVLLIIPDESEE